MDGLGGLKLDTVALDEFFLVGQCIGKSRKSVEDAFSLEPVAQEVIVKFGPLSSSVICVPARCRLLFESANGSPRL